MSSSIGGFKPGFLTREPSRPRAHEISQGSSQQARIAEPTGHARSPLSLLLRAPAAPGQGGQPATAAPRPSKTGLFPSWVKTYECCKSEPFYKLHVALMRFEDAQASESVKKADRAVIGLAGPHRWTALHIAAIFGREQAAKALLERGASPSQVDSHGWTAAHYAAVTGHAGLVQALATGEASDKRNPWGATPQQVLDLVDAKSTAPLHADPELLIRALFAKPVARVQPPFERLLQTGLRDRYLVGGGLIDTTVQDSKVSGKGLFIKPREAKPGQLIGPYGTNWAANPDSSTYTFAGPEVQGKNEVLATFFNDASGTTASAKANHGWPPTVAPVYLPKVDGLPQRLIFAYLGYMDGDADAKSPQAEVFASYPSLFNIRLWTQLIDIDLEQIVAFFGRHPIAKCVAEISMGSLVPPTEMAAALRLESLEQRYNLAMRDPRAVIQLAVVTSTISVRDVETFYALRPVQNAAEKEERRMMDLLLGSVRKLTDVRKTLPESTQEALNAWFAALNAKFPAQTTAAVLSAFCRLAQSEGEAVKNPEWCSIIGQPMLEAMRDEAEAAFAKKRR